MLSLVTQQMQRVIRSRVTSRMLTRATPQVVSRPQTLFNLNIKPKTTWLNEKASQKRFFSQSKAHLVEDGKPKKADDDKAVSLRDKPTTLVASTISTVYPISKRTLYPGLRMPLPLSKMTPAAAESTENVALFYVKDGPSNPDDPDNKPKVHDIGYWAIILNEKLAPGYPLVEVQPLRVQITEIISTTPFRAHVKPLADEPYDVKDPEIEQKLTTLKLTLMQIYEILAQRQSHEVDYIHRFLDMLKVQKSLKPSVIADTCMQFLPNFDASELQQVVEALNVKKRLDVVITLLRKQYAVLKDAFHLSQTFTIDKESKESYLNEELKKLQKESGIASDEKEKLLEKYKQRMENKNIPEDVRRVIKEEMDKLMSLEPMLMEYGVTNNYLDWLTALPWGIFSQDKYDIAHARKVLDEDHYGLKDIKERILEFISVGALTGNVQGKILCLVGPPGTGKTSIGQSIARALDRKFFRFSVGGMNDVAEIKGHRRTYVGAMPGKFVQCLKLRETSNPVILIDEIDKVGNSIMGDPSSALLEALDPQQNATFLDHYLDVPYDLSKVLFVCTANVLDTIPRPLLDRMEVLTLSGYVLEEKMNIVKRHLLPNARKNTQLKSTLVKVTESAVKKLIHQYCREAGVRQLQKQIDNIFSKAAYKLQKEKQTKGTETPITVNHDNLEEYVGKPKYTTDRHYETCPPGVVMGLSWTPMGGSALYVETVIEGTRDHDEGLKTTGQMGEVMKESSNIAFTYARNFLYSVAPENRFFEQYSVHMHLPEGATSKDGPSAGVPMVTSLLSLALNKSVIDDMAISGEITLSGKILPVGAIKEKIIAASRANIKHVILPVDNKVDWEELEENITRGITPHFVNYYKDVYEIAFGTRDVSGDGSGGKTNVQEKEPKKKSSNSKEKKQPVVEKKEEKPSKKKNSPKPVRKQKNEIELPPQPQQKKPDANQIIVNNTNNPVSDN